MADRWIDMKIPVNRSRSIYSYLYLFSYLSFIYHLSTYILSIYHLSMYLSV